MAETLTAILKQRNIPAPSLTALRLLRENGLDEATEYLRYVLAMSLNEAREQLRQKTEFSALWKEVGQGAMVATVAPESSSARLTTPLLLAKQNQFGPDEPRGIIGQDTLPHPFSQSTAMGAAGARPLAAVGVSACGWRGKRDATGSPRASWARQSVSIHGVVDAIMQSGNNGLGLRSAMEGTDRYGSRVSGQACDGSSARRDNRVVAVGATGAPRLKLPAATATPKNFLRKGRTKQSPDSTAGASSVLFNPSQALGVEKTRCEQPENNRATTGDTVKAAAVTAQNAPLDLAVIQQLERRTIAIISNNTHGTFAGRIIHGRNYQLVS